MGVGMAIGTAVYQTYAGNKALEAQGAANAKTARNYVTSMNYSFQNLEQERQDAFESTVADLEKNKLQGNRQEAMVAAAVNEGIVGGGRTANLIKRSAEADTNRALVSIKENYTKKMNEIDLNKEATLHNAQTNISSIREVEKPSVFGTLMNLGTAYYNARTAGEQIKTIQGNAGVGTAASPMYDGSSYKPDYTGIFGGTDFLSNPSSKYKFQYINPFG